MLQQMFWFMGVVEDRYDPEQMGRVKVRIFGQHTADTTLIPTEDLPWAHVMMPSNSASISGIGHSPTGLVEGSWVVGFFADGENCQDPIVMGSLPGKPSQDVSSLKAFKDPTGNYPRWINETDVSYVARDKWSSHPSYAKKAAQQNKDNETASAPKLDTTSNPQADSYYERGSWSEPSARDGSGGEYPFVHVYETEQGILREYDDTRGAPRIHEFHPSGTFYEVYPEGKKVTKVVSDNYTIIFGKDHVLIQGDADITIEGDVRHLIKGDYTVEVGGDYNLKVHGGRNTKITKNDNIEILGNLNTNIKEDQIHRVGNDQTLLVDNNKTESIGGKSALTVTGAADITMLDTYSMFSSGAQQISTNDSQRFLSKAGLEFGSEADWNLTCNANLTITTKGNFNIETDGNFVAHSKGSSAFTSDTTSTMTSTGAFGVTASRIDLN